MAVTDRLCDRDGRDPVDLLPAAMKEQMTKRTDAWESVLQ
jgi:hypothetical protein